MPFPTHKTDISEIWLKNWDISLDLEKAIWGHGAPREQARGGQSTRRATLEPSSTSQVFHTAPRPARRPAGLASTFPLCPAADPPCPVHASPRAGNRTERDRHGRRWAHSVSRGGCARAPVATPQPSKEHTSSGAVSETLAIDISLSTVYLYRCGAARRGGPPLSCPLSPLRSLFFLPLALPLSASLSLSGTRPVHTRLGFTPCHGRCEWGESQ